MEIICWRQCEWPERDATQVGKKKQNQHGNCCIIPVILLQNR